MTADLQHAAAAPPVPGGAAAGVVPDIAAQLRAADTQDLEGQMRVLDQAAQQLRHALDATRQ